ncbi:hypothetical protein FCN80_00850 [Martelella alba]|uniref:Uncharacterized protein n=1 Tax=Martelella alba TaxID=2590451 RepID=A0ABY2SSN1_9HYPH|nr:hypothetical protein FCN80_00850 [Martelella alba]
MNTMPINSPSLMRPINRLMQRGLKVLNVNTKYKRPVIVVDRPFSAWEKRAVEITEIENGVHRTVKMVHWRDFRVIWR